MEVEVESEELETSFTVSLLALIALDDGYGTSGQVHPSTPSKSLRGGDPGMKPVKYRVHSPYESEYTFPEATGTALSSTVQKAYCSSFIQ